jgi:hypothetical protein
LHANKGRATAFALCSQWQVLVQATSQPDAAQSVYRDAIQSDVPSLGARMANDGNRSGGRHAATVATADIFTWAFGEL